jgi:hypothetical protein
VIADNPRIGGNSSGPPPDRQIRFLVNLQRLLNEGLFVASYKFALLLSLADLSIAKGDAFDFRSHQNRP